MTDLDVMPADIRVRRVTADDGAALAAANTASSAHHHPWVAAPSGRTEVAAYLARTQDADFAGLLAVTPGDAIVGVFNLSQIFRGGFQNAYLGFYGMAAFAGRGLVAAGLRRVLDHAFGDLALHRIEANVQPGNERSRRLVTHVGFRLEGFSPRYLHIDGAWRDHERYAITAEEWPPERAGVSGHR